MSQLLWTILGLGALVGAGMYFYAASKDEKDPFGYLSETFQRFDLGDVFPRSFLNSNYDPDIKSKPGSSIDPRTGESVLRMFGGK